MLFIISFKIIGYNNPYEFNHNIKPAQARKKLTPSNIEKKYWYQFFLLKSNTNDQYPIQVHSI